MNPLSLSYYTVPELSPPDMVSVAAEAGCAHVGLRLLGGQPDGEPMPLLADPSLRRAMKRRMAETGVTALDANTARILPHTDLDAFRPFLEVAAELGARHVLATGDDPDLGRLAERRGGAGAGRAARHVLATGDDPDLGRLAERLGRLCDDAGSFGLTVQFEFVPWMSVPSVTAADALLDRIDRPTMGIALDALHYHRSGGTPAAVAAVNPARFAYMHLCDAPAAYADDRDSLLHVAVKERLFPGEGGIDLAGLLRALPPVLPLALEIPTATLARSVDAPARVARAVAATRRLLATL